ncbi:MAG: SGNH/GDSL hydrolase family protein [Acidobacteria bacterium]|nr:SGNH/GDSL hydrolase family protein [Acidobacteriota bacterium]
MLGASDGIGVGGSIVCAPFDLGCENGTGYAQTLRRRLQADGRTVTYNNLSVPGYVLSNAIVELAQRSGRSDTPGTFIDRYTPFIPPTTTVITLFVGGNDANIIGSAVNAGLGGTGSGVRDFVDAQVRQWGNDLGDLIARIRTRAPNARIVAYNLPNLALAPYIASRPVSEKGVMQRIATGLADQVNALTSRGVLVVDMMCDARVVQASSFASDGFHPSDAGYALMADIAYSAVANGSAATPQSSCPVRTAVPVF